MVEDNTNQRDSILPSERGAALKMQLEAIKRQGARDGGDTKGQRSNEIVAQRNNTTVKHGRLMFYHCAWYATSCDVVLFGILKYPRFLLILPFSAAFSLMSS